MKKSVVKTVGFILSFAIMTGAMAFTAPKVSAASNAELSQKAYEYLKAKEKEVSSAKFVDSDLVDIYNDGNPIVITYVEHSGGEGAEILFHYLDEDYSTPVIQNRAGTPIYAMPRTLRKPSGFGSDVKYESRTYFTKVDGKNVIVSYSYTEFPESGRRGFSSEEVVSYYYADKSNDLGDKNTATTLILKRTKPPSFVPDAQLTQTVTNNGATITLAEFERLKAKYLITPASTWGFGAGPYAEHTFVNTSHERLRNYFDGTHIAEKVEEYEELEEGATKNQSKLQIIDLGHIYSDAARVYFNLTNSSDKTDYYRVAFVAYNVPESVGPQGSMPEVHFFNYEVPPNTTINGEFASQIEGSGLDGYGSRKVVKVDFENDAEMNEFRNTIPLFTFPTGDVLDYCIDRYAEGAKWFKDNFNITIKEEDYD